MITTEGYYGGRLYEAETFPATGRELESKLTIQEWLMDDSYKPLSGEEIQSLLCRYDTDPGIRAATHIHNSSVFSGGVLFEKESKDGSKMTKTAQKWYDSTWTQWGTKIIRQQSALGWCAASFAQHNLYVGIPVALELSAVTILYKLDTFGISHFVFLENTGNKAGSSMFLEMKKHNMLSSHITGQASHLYRYIPNVIVYIDQAPDIVGNLNSKIAILSDDIDMDEYLSQAVKTATNLTSNPPLILESIQAKYNADAVVQTIQPMSMLHGDGYTPHLPGALNSTNMADGMTREMEQKRYEYSKALAMMGSGGISEASSLARQHIQALAQQGQKEYYIGDGKSYVKQNMAESPAELLLNFRQARLERIFMVFGIPSAMMSEKSSLGGKATMNENAMIVFTNTQKQIKQQLLNYMNDMYTRIYFMHHALHTVIGTPLGQLNEELHQGTGVNIIMSGLPSDDVIIQLYMMGCLKFEAFTKFMAAKHSIPIDDFNDNPLLSLEDLNGIKPEEPATKKAKTKK